ncbi:MAG: hypothetical protein WCH60_13835 [Burkholderiales bacterium]
MARVKLLEASDFNGKPEICSKLNARLGAAVLLWANTDDEQAKIRAAQAGKASIRCQILLGGAKNIDFISTNYLPLKSTKLRLKHSNATNFSYRFCYLYHYTSEGLHLQAVGSYSRR